jgi:dipeptidyl aminopeptidase/acylaminoacyl peptidase
LPVGTPPELVAAYLASAKDPDFLRQVAPIYHLDSVSAVVQIHSGTADGEFLEETPPSWAAKLADGLVGAGRNVAYFSYPDQGHYFLGESWSVLLGRALELFDALLSTAP